MVEGFSAGDNVTCKIFCYFRASAAAGIIYVRERKVSSLPKPTDRKALHRDVDVGPQGDSEELVHVTSDNRLCLSNNLLLNIDGFLFFFNEDAAAIDFNNCLESAN